MVLSRHAAAIAAHFPRVRQALSSNARKQRQGVVKLRKAQCHKSKMFFPLRFFFFFFFFFFKIDKYIYIYIFGGGNQLVTGHDAATLSLMSKRGIPVHPGNDPLRIRREPHAFDHRKPVSRTGQLVNHVLRHFSSAMLLGTEHVWLWVTPRPVG